MNSRLILAGLAIPMLLPLPRAGTAQNGIVEVEIPYSETDYVECLDEDVFFDVTVTIRTHTVVTQDGGVHYVENWFIEGSAEGLTSGLIWYGRGTSPFTSNGNGGNQESWGWNVEAFYTPLLGGQKFKKSQRVRFVTDANGVPRLEHFPPYDYKCIGPQH